MSSPRSGLPCARLLAELAFIVDTSRSGVMENFSLPKAHEPQFNEQAMHSRMARVHQLLKVVASFIVLEQEKKKYQRPWHKDPSNIPR